MAKPYGITKEMTNQEGPKPKKHNKDLKNNNSKLPWWVELLFVQIGLPDKWLRNMLVQKKNSKQFIEENKKVLYVSLMIFLSLAYFYSIVKNAQTKNICMEGAVEYYRGKLKQEEYDSNIIKALSTNLCNGGSI